MHMLDFLKIRLSIRLPLYKFLDKYDILLGRMLFNPVMIMIRLALVMMIIQLALVMMKTLLKILTIPVSEKLMDMIIMLLKTALAGVTTQVQWVRRATHLKMRYVSCSGGLRSQSPFVSTKFPTTAKTKR